MLSVILCAYNEELAIGELLEKFASMIPILPLEVILIDDASTDRTSLIAKNYLMRLPLRLVRHPENWGLGLSIRQGLEIALPNLKDQDYVATMDADATHPPETLKTLIAALQKFSADIAIASRYEGPGSAEEGTPLLRRLLAKAARRLLAVRFPALRSIKDSTTGFRCYRAGCLRSLMGQNGKILLKQKRFAIQMELLLALKQQNFSAVEIPFRLNYRQKRSTSGFRYYPAIQDYCALLFTDPKGTGNS